MNLNATLDRQMPKKATGRPASGKRLTTAKIDVETLRRAKVVAGFKNKTIDEYLTESLNPIIDRDLRMMAAGMIEKPK